MDTTHEAPNAKQRNGFSSLPTCVPFVFISLLGRHSGADQYEGGLSFPLDDLTKGL